MYAFQVPSYQMCLPIEYIPLPLIGLASWFQRRLASRERPGLPAMALHGIDTQDISQPRCKGPCLVEARCWKRWVPNKVTNYQMICEKHSCLKLSPEHFGYSSNVFLFWSLISARVVPSAKSLRIHPSLRVTMCWSSCLWTLLANLSNLSTAQMPATPCWFPVCKRNAWWHGHAWVHGTFFW